MLFTSKITLAIKFFSIINYKTSIILYKENDFYYVFQEPRMSMGISFGVDINNFRRMQKLTILSQVCTRCPSIDYACKLMETLHILRCSLKP